ncbi:MAG: c-type cytochrome [Verrucomicrobia bacterium]|nr:c-type cytochrome [Verrucomicrobiota bacterium]
MKSLTAKRSLIFRQRNCFGLCDVSKPLLFGFALIFLLGSSLPTRGQAATLATNLTVLPGYKAELIHQAQPDEGSWICMTVDDKGRFIISPEKNEAPLLRITVSRDGHLQQIEKIAAPMRAAMGLLYAHNSLYVNGIGPNGVGLYRLIDENKNDRFDTNEVQFLKSFEGDNEHSYHAVVLGPDKMIYVMNGNMSKVPAGISPESPYQNYAEDLLLPRQWDANGHAKDVYAPGGHVMRTDPNGKKWELLYAGFRNAYDFDFDSDGEMFTFDSDMEWDIGAPWYRPTRILHCVIGGEYGWRSGSGKWPVYYPDSLPSAVDTALSSPTGVKFGTGGKFPEKYRRAFYASDWAYGRILAVHLEPDGATYRGNFESFVSGKPLNVVDLEFGKDGAMYFVTGGWRTQSELYRVSYTGSEKATNSSSPFFSKAKAAAKQRSIRHKLEAFHGKQKPNAVKFAWPYLSSSDQWLRYAARVAIESQEASQWQKRALAETNLDASIQSLLALVRSGDKALQRDLVTRLIWLSRESLNERQRLEALRVWQLCFIRMGKPDAELRDTSLRALSPLYPAKTESENRELCQLLVYLEAPDVVSKTLKLLAGAPTQEEQMHYAFVLRTLKGGWTLEEREVYFAWFNKALAQYKGGNSFSKFLVNTRQEASELLSPSERTQLASVLEAKAAPVVSAPVAPRPFVKEWKMEDLMPALGEVSRGRSFESGKAAFAATQCLECHRFGNEGGDVGPDITAAASRFNRRDLLESILLPSKVVGDKFQNTILIKHNDEEVTGWIVFETSDKVTIITDPITTHRINVKKSDIASRRISELSPMPDALVDTLTREEILDLLAYIESGGKKDSPAFVAGK